MKEDLTPEEVKGHAIDIVTGGVDTVRYSGTPPYDHPVYKTTSLLRPYSFKPKVKNIDSFYYFEDPVNATTSLLRPGFYGPTVVVLTGFHCTWSFESRVGKKINSFYYLAIYNNKKSLKDRLKAFI